jgi:hypothetical protein
MLCQSIDSTGRSFAAAAEATAGRRTADALACAGICETGYPTMAKKHARAIAPLATPRKPAHACQGRHTLILAESASRRRLPSLACLV